MDDLICHIYYDHQVAYDTTSLVPKQFCSKKLNIVPFVLMIITSQLLHVTSYMVYLPNFIYFLYFSQLKAFQILPQNKHYLSVIEIVVT